MTIKVGEKEYCLDGYANTNELQNALVECYQQGRADSEIIRKVFAKMEQPNNCLFNNISACCYPISDCMNCPITIDEMKS